MEAKVNLKELPPKKRFLYIWDYYKLWIIGGIFAICSIISAIYQYATAKDTLLQLILVNSSLSYEESIFAEDYLTEHGYSTDEYELIASSVEFKMTETSYQEDYYTLQALVARMTSGDIDIFSAPSDLFAPYATEGYLMDLSTVFSEEELLTYGALLVYTTDEITQKTYPCAFDFTDNAWMKTHGYYTGSCHMGILYNSANVEQVKQFLTYILTY